MNEEILTHQGVESSTITCSHSPQSLKYILLLLNVHSISLELHILVFLRMWNYFQSVFRKYMSYSGVEYFVCQNDYPFHFQIRDVI